MENIFEKYIVLEEKENDEYVVLKCDVKQKIKRYLSNGEIIIFYKVSYNNENLFVHNVYDTFEEANYMASIKNKEDKFYNSKEELDSKYPSKYSVLPLFEYDENNKFNLISYIASKCYVVEEVTDNHITDDAAYSDSSYNVLFPYADFKSFKERLLNSENNLLGEISYPEFLIKGKDNLIKSDFPEYSLNGVYLNVDRTSNLYDTFEEAQQVSRKWNQYMLERKISKSNAEEKDKIREEYNQNFNISYIYEEMIRRKMLDDKILNRSLNNSNENVLTLKKSKEK